VADDVMTNIVDRCLALEENAILVYRELASACKEPEIKNFWIVMAQEETSHVRFWRKLKEIAQDTRLPQIFEDPQAIYQELTETWTKAQALLARGKEGHPKQEAFVTACHLEFLLLHPAFSAFINTARALVGDEDLEKVYENHLNCLVEMLTRYGPATPELEIIAEALQRLWKGNKILAQQALTDSLTGLLNRQGFLRIAEHLAQLAKRRKEQIGLLMIDIDNFRKINERYGHEKGDQTLGQVGQVIKSNVRSSDLVGRYAGEEFVVFLFGTGRKGSQIVAEKIRTAVERMYFRPSLTVSVGAAAKIVSSDAAQEIQDLIRRADQSMCMAKQTGKNRVIAEGAEY